MSNQRYIYRDMLLSEKEKRELTRPESKPTTPEQPTDEGLSSSVLLAVAAALKKQQRLPDVGDYVLATKYGDGDPQDHWCVGFYAGLTNPEKYDPPRYDVVDGEGKNFRGNGFRRIKKITLERGAWMLKHAKDIELSGRSVWHFARCSMNPPLNAGGDS
jgi:hypothetical protein